MLWTQPILWGCGRRERKSQENAGGTGRHSKTQFQLMLLMFSNNAALSRTSVFPPAAAMSDSTAASHEKINRAAGAWKVKTKVWLKYCLVNSTLQTAFFDLHLPGCTHSELTPHRPSVFVLQEPPAQRAASRSPANHAQTGTALSLSPMPGTCLQGV